MDLIDRHRYLAALFTLCVAASVAGCAQPSIKRFENATRIDAIVNPGWWEFQEPFAARFAQLKETRGAACEDRATIEQVYAILTQYQTGWVEYWATQPESPPVTLRFQHNTDWLGTLDVYEAALGLVGNKIHRATREETARILKLICDCPTPDSDDMVRGRY